MYLPEAFLHHYLYQLQSSPILQIPLAMLVLPLVLLATAGMVQGYTIVDSGYIMRKNIDSIVKPGQYTSHMHSFFGNDAVNVNTSTTEELMSGCTTNSNPNDLSVYC
jgi:hypothetical protein